MLSSSSFVLSLEYNLIANKLNIISDINKKFKHIYDLNFK